MSTLSAGLRAPTVATVKRELAAGAATPHDVVARALEDARAVQEATNACTALDDAAVARAAAVAASGTDGPLAGVPFLVKEAFDVAGLPSTGCTRALPERRPTRSAMAVEAALRAGAVVVGTTNQHELACGATNRVSSNGPARNPWDTGRMTGGSSGGAAAAVAAGVVPFALGTDAGGSVRIPAAFCGVTALKPTHGAVSLDGVLRTAPSLDTAGPIARTASDCLLVFDVLRGRVSPPVVVPDDGPWVRIGLASSYFRVLDPDVDDAVRRAAATLHGLGCALHEVDAPDPAEGAAALAMIATAELARAFAHIGDEALLAPQVAAVFEFGRSVRAVDYVDAIAQGAALRDGFARAFRDVDVLLTPTTPFPALPLDATEVVLPGGTLDADTGPAALTNIVNVTGLPALSFPVGFSRDGLPVGAQLVGPPGSEALLCAIAGAYQLVTDWHTRRPGA